MPLERYKRAIEEEGVPYDIFLQQGFLRISGENQIQYRDVFQWFIDLVRIYKIKPLMTGYDRYSSQYLIQDITDCRDVCHDSTRRKNGVGKNLVGLQLFRNIRITGSDTGGHAEIAATAALTG